MASRTVGDLRTIILNLFPNEHVYILPPEDVKLVYPCWIIDFRNTESAKGDNISLFFTRQYKITHITHDSVETDSTIKMLSNFQAIRQDGSRAIIDGLSHDYYTLYW